MTSIQTADRMRTAGAPLADSLDSSDDDPSTPTVLTFMLGRQLLAVDVHRVREILDRSAIMPLPSAPHDVLGMIDLRGQTIAIVDLAGRIGVDPPAETGRIIVFELPNGGGTTSLGILADKVLRVREIGEDSVEEVPETLSDWRCDMASGMLRTDEGIAMILRIDHILGATARPGPFDF